MLVNAAGSGDLPHRPRLGSVMDEIRGGECQVFLSQKMDLHVSGGEILRAAADIHIDVRDGIGAATTLYPADRMGGDRAPELNCLEGERRCAYSRQVDLVRTWRKVGAGWIAADTNCVKAGWRRVGRSLVDQRICPTPQLNRISPAT